MYTGQSGVIKYLSVAGISMSEGRVQTLSRVKVSGWNWENRCVIVVGVGMSEF